MLAYLVTAVAVENNTAFLLAAGCRWSVGDVDDLAVVVVGWWLAVVVGPIHNHV